MAASRLASLTASPAARLSVRLRAMPSSQNMAIIQGIETVAPTLLPAGVRAQPTGDFVLLQDMTAELPYAMLRGLVVATVLIIGAMGAVFRSVKLAATDSNNRSPDGRTKCTSWVRVSEMLPSPLIRRW